MFTEIFHEFTFINLLSILAFITTVGLFFCGIPICRQIWKRKDTTEISGAPFLMGVLGGTCWMVYGYLKKDQTVEYVTCAQIVLYTVYTIFYWIMTKKKFWITIKILVLAAICAGLVSMVHFFGHKVFHPLGIVCMTLNTMDFGAPLAGLRVVIRRRATSTLPLPLCIANFMVSSEWFLYGLLVKDFYLITPNGIGSLLAFAQLILFVVLPRKPNQRAPILKLYDSICGLCGEKKHIDVETGSVDNAATGDFGLSKLRWSSRMISNVAGEIENVIQKVQVAEQFGYSQRLDKEDETTSSSSGSDIEPQKSEIPLSVPNPVHYQTTDDHLPPLCSDDEDEDEPISEEKADSIVFPITIRDPIQLFKLSRKLSRKQSGNWRKRPGFGFKRLNNMFESSLQPYHMAYMKRQQNGFPFESSVSGAIPEVDEDRYKAASELCNNSKRPSPKRAKSEPNLTTAVKEEEK